MRNSLKSYLTKGMLVAAVSFSLGMVACTKHPNEKQLQALEEQKKAALAAEDLLAQKRKERDDLQRQVEQKKAELAKAQQEKTTVSARLSQMPN
ncbi:MAG: hypothetical protein ONB48_00340 [candidate division KSB1 bacterium]|nr:hypothetical protein [candidate division KSB1 bacterium]MDZ7272876.1 hypothetical protein [candidate division KSB1 bacterium]MDZ7284101.1 hypothetical protein [candidate division KSB1 bacterium]MDZ7297501.1 hypothetical protein [candidate division KSB1 bacterium]MDZ7305637.1 hypothetical protein [candidate division KSB1 bacterium]